MVNVFQKTKFYNDEMHDELLILKVTIPFNFIDGKLVEAEF